MRLFSAFRFFLLSSSFFLVSAGPSLAQDLAYNSAPKEFMGYAFGSSLADVTGRLTQASAAFRQDPAKGKDGFLKVTALHQSLDALTDVTVELSFAQDRLFQVAATTAYRPEVLKGLVSVLTSKYGVVKSQDGGYSYLWFFFAKLPTTAQTPDFALVLRDDPVTAKTIVLTYADNTVKRAETLPPPGQEPAPAKDEAAPQLNSSSF